MLWSNGRLLVAVLASVLVGQSSSAFAQENLHAQGLPCSSPIVPVWVLDPNDRIVLGLTVSNFRARVHGHPATVLNASIDSSPRRIALLFDVSGSMLDPAIWKPALTIARTLVEGLPPEDSIAFLSFGSQVERKTDFTRDPKLILQQLDDLQASTQSVPKNMRQTALWDSVLEALTLFNSRGVGDSIYIISDGHDNHSRAGPSDVEKALLAAGVRFFALFPPGVDLERDGSGFGVAETGRPIQGREDLEELANMTGGALLPIYHLRIDGAASPLSPTELHDVLDKLRILTDRFYSLQIELPQPIDKHRDLQLEAVDPTRSGKLPLLLRYPRKFVPCDASTAR
jgi:hypothetical protein